MKNFYSELLYWSMTCSLGYMIYTGNYSYLNVVDVVYTLLLLFVSLTTPLMFIAYQVDTPEIKTNLTKVKNSMCGKGILSDLWKYSKVGLSLVVLAMSGHSIILGWYLVTTIMAISFMNWLSKQEV